jgi:uncharacterized protein with GYD domain
MATYTLLANFTDKESARSRIHPGGRFQRDGEKVRSNREGVFWTLGKYDIVAVVEAPDDISITAFGLSSGALGNVRTQTLRAFTQADVKTGKVVRS